MMWPLDLDDDAERPTWLDRLDRAISLAAVALLALAMIVGAGIIAYAIGAEIDPRVLRNCASVRGERERAACIERVTRTLETFRAVEEQARQPK